MTLLQEDLFSSTEMNNGLTAPSQVRELITVMEKERDLIVKQRSAVARTIAATENQDCLDLFIQLDGLRLISNWLKDAQKLSNNSSDCFVEESIFDFLRALEKLHLDYEKSLAFEIRTTAEILVDHKSSKVQDKARVLLESWKIKKCCIDDQVLSSSVDAVCPEQVESAPEPNKILDDEKLANPVCSKPIESCKSKTCEVQPCTSSSDVVVGMEDVTEESSQKNSSAGSENPCDELTRSNTDSHVSNPHEITTTQGPEAAQEAEVNEEKSQNSFDLNQEIFSEDFDLNVTESVEELSVETNSMRSEHVVPPINQQLFPHGNNDHELELFLNSGVLGKRKEAYVSGCNDDHYYHVKRYKEHHELDLNYGPNKNVIDLDSDFASQTPHLEFDFMGIDPPAPYVHSSRGPEIPSYSPIFGSAGPVSHF